MTLTARIKNRIRDSRFIYGHVFKRWMIARVLERRPVDLV